MICALGFMICALGFTEVSAETPEDNTRLTNEISFHLGAIDTATVLGIVPFDPISRPAELLEFSLNITNKHTAPAFYLPSDFEGRPDTDDNCAIEFRLPQLEDGFEDWFGFWTLKELSGDWGAFGAPSVFHANASVNVKVTPPRAAQLVEDAEGFTVTIPEGSHDVRWEAATQFSPAWDVAVPLSMMVLNQAVEAKYGDAIAMKIAGGSTGAARKLKIKASLAMSNVIQAAGIRGAEYSIENAGWSDQYATKVNAAFQSFTVWDQHTPVIETSQTNITLEARNFGGLWFSRASDELRAYLTYYDECGREVRIANDAPGFLPIGTTDIEWTVRDDGPYNDRPSTSSVIQRVTVEDSQAPLLVPPEGFAQYADGAMDAASFNFGRVRLSDLADPNPQVSRRILRNDQEVSTLEPDARYQVLYTATDASGNSTDDDDQYPDIYTQVVTLKTPGSNHAPTANDNSAETLTSEPVFIRLQGQDDERDFIDGMLDPLTFQIVERPPNGEFVIPDLPYFIEDFRLKPTSPPGNYDADSLSCPQDDGADRSDPAVFEAKLALLEGNQHGDWIEKCYCMSSGNPPTELLYGPNFMHITDEGDYYVADREWWCNVNDPYLAHRYSKHRDGEFVAAWGRFGQASAGGVFQVDPNGNLWRTLRAGAGSSSYISVDGNGPDLQPLDNQEHPPSAASYDSSTLSFSEHGMTMSAANLVSTHVDPLREVVYVNDKSRIYMFDYFDPEDTFLGAVNGDQGFGTCGAATSTTFNGYWMVTDSEGYLYLVCRNKVIKFSAPSTVDGQLQAGSTIGWLGKCTGNANNPDTGVPYNHCDVEKQASRGFQCTDETCLVDDAVGDGPGQFDRASHLAVDPHDNLYVVDSGNSRIQRFGRDGTFAGQAKSSGEGVTVDGGFVLGNMGEPQYVSVNSNEFHVLETDRYDSGGDYFLHIFKATPFTDVTDTAATVEYVSQFGFQGEDRFSFRVTDGIDASLPAEVTVAVSRAFRPPYDLAVQCFESASFAVEMECAFNEDEDAFIRLSAQDYDGFQSTGGLDVHSFELVNELSHATLTVLASQDNHVDYRLQPDADYFGEDSFEFRATDCIEGTSADYCSSTEFETLVYDLDFAPVRDDTRVNFPDEIKVARGFKTGFQFEFEDVDRDSFPQPQALSVAWGDGVVAFEAMGWENIGIEDEDGDPIEPQVNALPGEGLVVGAHVYDSAALSAILCFYTEGDSEPACDTSPAIEVLEVPILALTRSEDPDAMESEKPPGAEPGEDYQLDTWLLNKTPETWAGLNAPAPVVFYQFPEGITVTQMDSRCSVVDQRVGCNLADMAVGESQQISFTLQLDAAIAAEEYQFNVDVELDHSGAKLDGPTFTSIAIQVADDDLDAVINYYDAFPNDARYSLDSDEDGIADSWEQRYGLNSGSADDAALDSDGDGLSNREEFYYDSYPLLADALYREAPASSGSPLPDRLGFRVAAGDINNDGYSDVIAAAPSYGASGAVLFSYGSEQGVGQSMLLEPAVALSEFGRALASGDLNGDGFADLAVASNEGLLLFWGSATGLSGSKTIFPPQSNSGSFATSLLIEDLDNDGNPDLLVGAPGDTQDSFSGSGLVYLFRASSNYWQDELPEPDMWISPGANGAAMGQSLAIGDFDNDSLADLVVGAPFSGNGQVFGYLGSALLLSFASDGVSEFSFVLNGENAADRFGYALSSGVDIDGDSGDDLAVGAYAYDDAHGAAYLYASSDAFWSSQQVWERYLGAEAGDQYGVALALVETSSYSQGPQLLVGSNRAETTKGPDAGRTDLYRVASSENIDTRSGLNRAMLGYSVAAAGDVNGDSEPDLVVGAPNLAIGDYDGAPGNFEIYYGGRSAAQLDSDGDKVADSLDNCPSVANTDQADADADTVGDACDDENGGGDGNGDGDGNGGGNGDGGGNGEGGGSGDGDRAGNGSGGGGGGPISLIFCLVLLCALATRRRFRLAVSVWLRACMRECDKR